MFRSNRRLASCVQPGDRALYVGGSPRAFFAASKHHRPGSAFVSPLTHGLVDGARHIVGSFPTADIGQRFDLLIIDRMSQFIPASELADWSAAIERVLAAGGRAVVSVGSFGWLAAMSPQDLVALADPEVGTLDGRRSVEQLAPAGYHVVDVPGQNSLGDTLYALERRSSGHARSGEKKIRAGKSS